MKLGYVLTKVNDEALLNHWLSPTDAVRRITHTKRPMTLTFRCPRTSSLMTPTAGSINGADKTAPPLSSHSQPQPHIVEEESESGSEDETDGFPMNGRLGLFHADDTPRMDVGASTTGRASKSRYRVASDGSEASLLKPSVSETVGVELGVRPSIARRKGSRRSLSLQTSENGGGGAAGGGGGAAPRSNGVAKARERTSSSGAVYEQLSGSEDEVTVADVPARMQRLRDRASARCVCVCWSVLLLPSSLRREAVVV